MSTVPADERKRLSRMRESEDAGNLPEEILEEAVRLGIPEDHLLPSLSDYDHRRVIDFYFGTFIIITIIKWCTVKKPGEYFMGVLKVGKGALVAISSIAVKTMREVRSIL